MMRIGISILAAALLTVGTIGLARAAWEPTQPVRIVVPYPPGGASDVAARLISDRLSEELRQRVVVENRAGAGGIVGTDLVYRANPDGYTLLLGASDALSIAPHLQPQLTRYKPEEFVAVSPVNLVTTVLVTKSDLGVKTIPELLALGKTKQLTYASWGNGSLGHVSAESFRFASKMDLLNVPYQGAGPAAQSVLAGQVDLMFMPGPLWLSFHERVVSLGVASETPFQNVPSLSSQGVPVDVVIWQGILAPPKTPIEIVERLHAAFAKVLDAPEMKDRFIKMGSTPLSLSQEGFASMVKKDIAHWRKTLVDLNIQPQ
jgi:tripartite-type tricarboxylate transporter receptor subunit TctC